MLRTKTANSCEKLGVRPGVRRARATRRGATLVESAIVMNVFLLFIFGIMEFGHYVMVRELMDNAARDGARMASTGTSTVTTTQITNFVTGRLAGQVPTGLNIQVYQADPTTGANIGAWTNAGIGDTVAVSITGTYKPMLSMASILPTALPVSSKAMCYSESPN